MTPWAYWHSIKDNDGRRASGVRRNQSAWHYFTVPAPEALPLVDFRAICGMPYQIEAGRFVEEPRLDQESRICRRCQARRHRMRLDIATAVEVAPKGYCIVWCGVCGKDGVGGPWYFETQAEAALISKAHKNGQHQVRP